MGYLIFSRKKYPLDRSIKRYVASTIDKSSVCHIIPLLYYMEDFIANNGLLIVVGEMDADVPNFA